MTICTKKGRCRRPDTRELIKVTTDIMGTFCQSWAAWMQQCLLALILASLSTQSAWAQDNDDGPGKKTFDLLWSIKGEKNHIYLLGSVHLLPHGARSLPDVVHAAYMTSDLIVFESDLFLIGSVAFEADELAQARYAAGHSIHDEMPADLMPQVENKVEDLGLPVAIFRRHRPWVFAQTPAPAPVARAGSPRDPGLGGRPHPPRPPPPLFFFLSSFFC